MSSIVKGLINKLRGREDLNSAVKRGLQCGTGCTDMGGCNFGSEPYLITLGDYVRISGFVQFVTHDGGSWFFRRAGKYKDVVNFGRIKVGNNVFLGTRCIIMPNVKIGNNCVIGAGSIVTKDVPDNSVAVGVPAKVIMTIDEYAQKMKSKMPEGWNPKELAKNKRGYLEKIFKE